MNKVVPYFFFFFEHLIHLEICHIMEANWLANGNLYDFKLLHSYLVTRIVKRKLSNTHADFLQFSFLIISTILRDFFSVLCIDLICYNLYQTLDILLSKHPDFSKTLPVSHLVKRFFV